MTDSNKQDIKQLHQELEDLSFIGDDYVVSYEFNIPVDFEDFDNFTDFLAKENEYHYGNKVKDVNVVIKGIGSTPYIELTTDDLAKIGNGKYEAQKLARKYAKLLKIQTSINNIRKEQASMEHSKKYLDDCDEFMICGF